MKQNIKKILKVFYILLLICLCIKVIVLGIRIYAETKTDTWFIWYESEAFKTLNEKREKIKENKWEEIGIEHGRLIVEAPNFSEDGGIGFCKIQFWKDGTGAKAVYNPTIYNSACKPVREQYAKDHPVLFYIITGRGIF